MSIAALSMDEPLSLRTLLGINSVRIFLILKNNILC